MRAKLIIESLGFTEDGDPIQNMGIGEKGAIKYSINRFYKLDEEDLNLLTHSFYTFYMSEEFVVSFMWRRRNEKIDYEYFEKLAEKSGLESYININDNNRDLIHEIDEVSWSVQEKYQNYFEEIENESK